MGWPKPCLERTELRRGAVRASAKRAAAASAILVPTTSGATVLTSRSIHRLPATRRSRTFRSTSVVEGGGAGWMGRSSREIAKSAIEMQLYT
jgi:hypothetical protein